MSKLYERVREARALTKLTQEGLAGELGVTRSAVAQWEMAEGAAPSVDNLIGLARRSGMAFEYLATGRGERTFGPPVPTIAEEPAQYRHLDEQQRVLLNRFDTLAPRQRSGLLDLLLAESKTRRRR
ncbi:helix-turn-helix domain-containing protein [Xanthomonas arboricola]|uniref:helix-turn-helix domain-containing protein n=1 Tax=Xanthomonas arboricola TaxID=56448 RepID=UPI000CEF56D8|nr:helix-turn-helix domain-containing protein [Xanthomonas arboricola]PPU10467.1 transcriptional regulator [Xanthomonas arboricola]